MGKELDLGGEVKRKRIHYIGLSVPILYYFSNKELMLVIIGAALFVFILIDYLRLYTKNRHIDYLFGKKGYSKHVHIKVPDGKTIERDISLPTLEPILRPEEKRSWGSHTYYAVGAFICILLYSKDIAICSTAALVIGDSIAAIVGKMVGNHRIYKKKTLEGSLACFLSCLAVCYLVVSLPLAMTGATTTTLTELYTVRINDNLSIPVVCGAVMTLVNYLI
ncbi:MAG TPA: SEC59/DGK1/VTE5 family protein [Candidatus Methanofastidiosa archaeon]|nr:SEC59/DGK1/VTE5 family protein [Candidatus Methanofastidiosa archaeon]HPR41271.1 SEC59/DGK1/VTE5 family protein [Candidatus Methanofastidiosa archaeon]